MKIIFLDIDGVLNWRGTEDRIDGFVGLDPELIAQFNRITEAHPDAKIVISSSWRHCSPFQKAYQDFAGLVKLLHDRGLKGEVIDHTPIHFGSRGRGNEIREWLEKWRRAGHTAEYVVLDDDRTAMAPYIPTRSKWDTDEDWEEVQKNIEEDLRPRWVKTSFNGYPVRTMYGGGYEGRAGGLREEFADQAIKILGGELREATEPAHNAFDTPGPEWEG